MSEWSFYSKLRT